MSKTMKKMTDRELSRALAEAQIARDAADRNCVRLENERQRRANSKARAKQEAAGTKQIRVSSLKIGMELKVPGGFQKIMHLRRPERGYLRSVEKRIVLANGKYRTRLYSDMVTVKA